MMASAQQKSFCVLHVSKTESVISVQRAFQSRFGIAAPSAKNVCRWCKQFEEKAACVKGKAQGDQGLQRRQS